MVRAAGEFQNQVVETVTFRTKNTKYEVSHALDSQSLSKNQRMNLNNYKTPHVFNLTPQKQYINYASNLYEFRKRFHWVMFSKADSIKNIFRKRKYFRHLSSKI